MLEGTEASEGEESEDGMIPASSVLSKFTHDRVFFNKPPDSCCIPHERVYYYHLRETRRKEKKGEERRRKEKKGCPKEAIPNH